MRAHAEGERWDEAIKVAALAAPYIHPRLSAVDPKAEADLVVHAVSDQPLTADEWMAEVAGRSGAA